jgi:hypothetical protein
MAKGKRDVSKQSLWQRRIRAQRSSGLSVRAFCERERVSEPSFYAWRRTLAERDADDPSVKRAALQRAERRRVPAFVSLTAGAAASWPGGLHTALELVHPSGNVLRIAAGCDQRTLAMVLAALSSAQGEAGRC